MIDVGVIGAGIAGMATAARLQARGRSTIVLEAHGQPGGCAGFFRRRGFAFDVGATTLVDFETEGVGGELLESIGLTNLPAEQLPGYVAWLPDRKVTLHRQSNLWANERLQAFGQSRKYQRFWKFLDQLTNVFWQASRKGVKLPIQNFRDARKALACLGLRHLPLLRYLRWTMLDALKSYGLHHDKALCGLLSMLLEDTVHAKLEDAPLINGTLGISIRGAGLTRTVGGMYGFWRRFRTHYQRMGGNLRVGCPVSRIDPLTGQQSGYRIHTRRGSFDVKQVVAAVPIALTAKLAPTIMARKLDPYLQRDAKAQGGAIVVFLGVPDDEVANQRFTHHQLLQSYDQPLGNGNNMFISVSAKGDEESAPLGHRAVMISTHCELAEWEQLTELEYRQQKAKIGNHLLHLARRVYPQLGENAQMNEIASPCTYERFTHRPRGAVGGVRQTLHNSNQRAVPHDIGIPGFWLVGDTTWPGLGTVACVLGSRIVAEGVDATLPRKHGKEEARDVLERIA